jgi:MOSC domain-containing protein YiiM
MKNRMELVNFSIGLPKQMKYGKEKEMSTGICKEQVEEAFLASEGFRGDGVADKKHHGGLDRAVCLYPYEHYSLWEQEFKTSLPANAFGENLTVTNMLERDVCIGDIYQVGEAVIQVTQGRIPCSTINKRTNIPELLKKIVETGYSGFLCRVLEEGIVRKDSTIKLIEQHPKKVSVLEGIHTYFHNNNDAEAIKRVLEIDELADRWREIFTRQLEKIQMKN